MFYIQRDININLLNNSDTMSQRYIDCLLPNNIVPCITKPTRVTDTTATLVDHINIFRPLMQLSSFVHAGCLLLDISDHLGTFFVLSDDIKSTNTPSIRPKIRIFSEKNIQMFVNEINHEVWTDLYMCNT